MSNRTTTSPISAFSGTLSGIVRTITDVAQRESWPAPVQSINLSPNSASPYAVQGVLPPLPSSDEVLSLVIPSGRWVVVLRSIMDGNATGVGTSGGYAMVTNFMEGTTVLATQKVVGATFTLAPTTTLVATHGYVVTDIYAEPTTFSIRVAAGKTNTGDTFAWFLRNFAILAFPG